MTEPTTEQVAMDRERARAQRVLDESKGWCGCNSCVETIAIALRDRAIEAHAAGRDEGLREADDELNGRILGTGCSGDVPMRLARDAIRALRGRT